MMLTVSKLRDGQVLCSNGMAIPAEAQFLTVCKGAPNFVLDCCSELLADGGTPIPLTGDLRAEVLDVVDTYSSQALRVLAIAAKCTPTLPVDLEDDSISTDTRFDVLKQKL